MLEPRKDPIREQWGADGIKQLDESQTEGNPNQSIFKDALNYCFERYDKSLEHQEDRTQLFVTPFKSGFLASLLLSGFLIVGLYELLLSEARPGITSNLFWFVIAVGPGALVGALLGAFAGMLFGYKQRSPVTNALIGGLGGVGPSIVMGLLLPHYFGW